MVKRKNCTKRPRRVTRGVPTIFDGDDSEHVTDAENAEVWDELGLSAYNADEEYHMTNYWISESRELEKTATKVPKGKESRVKKGNAVHNERKPNTDEFSYDSKMKSIIAHLISADEYSLIIEREGDSSPYGVASSENNLDVLPSSGYAVEQVEKDCRAVIKPNKSAESPSSLPDDDFRNIAESSHRTSHEKQFKETDIHFGHLCIEEDSNDDNRKPLSTETSDAMKETKENRPELENCGNRFESPEIAATVDEHFVQSESKSTQQAVGRIANSNRVKTPHKLATPDWSFVPHSEHLGSLGEKLNFVQPQNLKRKRRKALIPVTHSPIEDSKGAIHSSIPESEAFLNEEIDRAGPAAPPSLEFGIGNQRPYEPVEKHDVSKTNHGRNYLFADKKLSNSPAVKFTRYSSVQSRRLADSGVIEQNNGPASPLRKAYCAEGDSLGNIVKLNSEVLYSTPGTDCNRNPVSISGNTYDRKSASIEIVESRSEVHKEDAYEEDMPGGLRTMDGCISFEGITEPPSSGQGKNELASSDAASERNQSKNARNLRSKIMDDPTSKPLPTLQEDFKSDTSNRFSASFPDFLNKSTEMGQTSMDTAFDQFRRSTRLPFSTSTPIRPGIFISSPFGSSQNRSPLAPIQPSPNLSFVNEAGERKSEAEKSSIVERPDQEETLWRSQSIHNDMAICSSGYWGIVKQKRQTLGREEHIVGKQDTSRNLSIREEDPNRMPFFLVGFPWTKSYAKKRDFKKEMIFLCGQKAVLKWGALKEILDISNAKKLGEGTYGEVFTAKHKGEPVAIKIIPAGGAVKVNDEPQNSFRDVQLELIVSKELAELKVEENGYRTEGFIQLITSCVCMGRYPKELLCAWDEYNIDEKSENDDPRMFPANQCYLILACEQGGSDLENYEVKSINQAYSIITQVITALAVAEDRLCYEHRDLHVGNVLVSECDDRFREELIAFHKVRVSTYGVSVKVIDFTCSRMRKGSSTIFLNLANDKALFEGKGDLQFDIYRLMKKANRNNWARFNPKTNVMWIVYLTRYINAKLEENQIGTAEERERFVRLFQSMHRFDGSMSEWILHGSRRLADIVEVEECAEEVY